MTDKFLQVEVLYSFLALEPYILLALLVLSCWLFYKFFLQDVSAERHVNLRKHSQVLVKHFAILTLLFIGFYASSQAEANVPLLSRVTPYFALLTFIWGMIVFIKSCRLGILQFMFLQSMKEGVPLLIVNVFTLIISLGLGFWATSKLFNLDLGPLLATSAAFSIILGLALQDTLGNLFAGISLQLDDNIQIGDWIEVASGIQKAIGQVKEISWRSVTLLGLSDEVVTLPNRFIAQAQISNFSPNETPIIRSQVFRLPYGSDTEKAKNLLEQSIAGLEKVRGLPAPLAYVAESTDSWLTIKLIYYIDSYGSQWSIGDRVLTRGLELLAKNGFKAAHNQLHVSTEAPNA